MPDYFFLKEDYYVLEKTINDLKNKVISLGKEQGEVAGQSTENFGHDDACQEVIENDRRIVLSRLDELKIILNNAKVITPLMNSKNIRFGSIVELSNGKVYQIGSFRVLAEHLIENVSYNSPFGQKLLGKKKGDEIIHNGNIISIKNIR